MAYEFYLELLLERKVEVTWGTFLQTVRYRLGITLDALRTELQHFRAQKGETLS